MGKIMPLTKNNGKSIRDHLNPLFYLLNPLFRFSGKNENTRRQFYTTFRKGNFDWWPHSLGSLCAGSRVLFVFSFEDYNHFKTIKQ